MQLNGLGAGDHPDRLDNMSCPHPSARRRDIGQQIVIHLTERSPLTLVQCIAQTQRMSLELTYDHVPFLQGSMARNNRDIRLCFRKWRSQELIIELMFLIVAGRPSHGHLRRATVDHVRSCFAIQG